MENPIWMDDLGGTTIFGNIHIPSTTRGGMSLWLPPQEGEKRRRIEGANYARRAAEKASKKAGSGGRVGGVMVGWFSCPGCIGMRALV